MPPFTTTVESTDQVIALGLMLVGMLADHILVACRLAGLLVTLPGIGKSSLPWHLKGILLIVLAGIIAPNVSLAVRTPNRAPQRNQLADHADEQIRTVSHEATDARTLEGKFEHSFPQSGSVSTAYGVVQFAGLAGCEVCLGLLLGLGAWVVLQGLKMAGQLIDHQTGWGIASTGSPDDADGGGTVTGELLGWIGTVGLFALGGHLLLISTLMETFRTFPPGAGNLNLDVIAIASHLIHQSCSLALRLSAPIIATQILAGIILSHAAAVAPQFQQSGTGTIVRLFLAFVVLLLTLTGLSDQLFDLFRTSILIRPS